MAPPRLIRPSTEVQFVVPRRTVLARQTPSGLRNLLWQNLADRHALAGPQIRELLWAQHFVQCVGRVDDDVVEAGDASATGPTGIRGQINPALDPTSSNKGRLAFTKHVAVVNIKTSNIPRNTTFAGFICGIATHAGFCVAYWHHSTSDSNLLPQLWSLSERRTCKDQSTTAAAVRVAGAFFILFLR